MKARAPIERRKFVAACIASGVSKGDAERSADAIALNARRAIAGRISTKAAVTANRALLCRVLAARPRAKEAVAA